MLKLGTSNVPQARHKMTPTVAAMATILLLGLFYARFTFSIFCLNQTSFIPNELVRRLRAIWALRAFQEGMSASPYLVKNEDIWFTTEREWAESNTMATS